MRKHRLLILAGIWASGLACILGVIPGSIQVSSADDHLEFIIEAFLNDPEFQPALEDLDEQGLVRGKPQAVEIVSSQCGVAGCFYSALVVQSFTRPGVNPGSFSVLALVSISPGGKISGVQRVDLKPWEENQLGNNSMDSAPFPKIPAEGKIELLPRSIVERLPESKYKLEVTLGVPVTEPKITIEMALPPPP